MSDEYTPVTEAVKHAYIFCEVSADTVNALNADAEFDRWLAAHDAEVKAEQREADAEIAGDWTWRDSSESIGQYDSYVAAEQIAAAIRAAGADAETG